MVSATYPVLIHIILLTHLQIGQTHIDTYTVLYEHTHQCIYTPIPTHAIKHIYTNIATHIHTYQHTRNLAFYGNIECFIDLLFELSPDYSWLSIFLKNTIRILKFIFEFIFKIGI